MIDKKKEAGLATVICMMMALILSTVMLLIVFYVTAPATKIDVAIVLSAYSASFIAVFVSLRKSFEAFMKFLSIVLVTLCLSVEDNKNKSGT